MNKLKVGDRVAFYNTTGRSVGTVRYIWSNSWALDVVTSYTETVVIVHYKQCRKLKPKKPLRTIWVTESSLNRLANSEVAFSLNPPPHWECVQFREVRKKK